MNNFKNLYLVAFTLLFSVSSFAVETTSDLKGSAAAGAEVTITNTSTGASVTVTADSSGNFYALNLQPGGPYTVSSSASTVNGVLLTVGKTSVVSLVGSDAVEDLVVTGSAITAAETTFGPSSVFSSTDLANAASYDRDIKQLLATNPNLYIAEDNENALVCMGQNSRINGLTVDGIALNDTFGLNANGYPAERMPFSYDAIDQVVVEFAPYDVQYGGFSACVVNAVTKSGGDTTSGNFFVEITNDSLTGDTVDHGKVTIPSYDEVKYGFTVGGKVPVNQDINYFVAYEKYDDQDLGEYGYAGSGMPSELPWLSKADYDRIVQIANDVYGFDPGGLPGALDSESEKLLVKLDYYVSDKTRAVFTYNYSDGFTNQASDASPTEFEFSNHFYKRGNELNAYMLQVFSSIGDINTTLKAGYKKLDNTQVGLGGSFGDFQISGVNGGKVYLGGTDDSRQNNKLNYETTTFSYVGDLVRGDQLLTFGIEYEDNEVFNMFMQESIGGEWDFVSIDAYEQGFVRFDFQNTTTLVPEEASKVWTYDITTLFVQNKVQLTDNYEVTVGMRYESYGVPEAPLANPDFAATYGYTNALTFDGEELFLPRIGFNYTPSDSVRVYGGFGAFAGGNPAVWFSNQYSNNGITIQDGDGDYSLFTSADTAFSGRTYSATTQCDPLTGAASTAGYGYSVPCGAIADVQAGGASGDTNSMDPNFELPIVHKLSIGASKDYDNGVNVTVDYMRSSTKKPFLIQNLANTDDGTVNNLGYTVVTASGCCVGDYSLTNSGKTPVTEVMSISVSKSYDNVDLYAGYTHMNAEDVHPMTSSVAYTNFNEALVTTNKMDPDVARSSWEIEDRFVAQMIWSVSDKTNLSLYWSANSGNPYSLSAYTGWQGFGYSPGWGGEDFPFVPVYIPLLDDPNVSFASADLEAAMNAWIDENGYERGKILERNSLTSEWFRKLDMKLTHDFTPNLQGYMVMRNVTNFLFDEGTFYQSSSATPVATISNNSDGTITIESLNEPSDNIAVGTPSLWNVKLGLNYTF